MTNTVRETDAGSELTDKLNGQLSFHLAVKKKAEGKGRKPYSRHIKRPIRTVMFHFFFRVFGIELTISMGLEMAFTLRRHRWDASTALSSHRAFPSDLHSSASKLPRCVSRVAALSPNGASTAF